jgi:hypothetical protein
MVHEGKNVGCELGHGEDWSVRNGGESADGKIGAQFRDTVTAKVGDDGTDATEFLSQRTPIVAIEGRGMEKNDRHPRSGFSKSEPCSKIRSGRVVDTVHIPGG